MSGLDRWMVWAVIGWACCLVQPAFGKPEVVTEPPVADRRIELRLMHPKASPQVVYRQDVRTLSLDQIRAILARKRGLYEDADISCLGGYNPRMEKGPGNFLSAVIFSTLFGERELFHSMSPDATAHEFCMARALELISNPLPR